MNERAAKVGVWAYLLFTVASFALALFYLLNGGFRSNVSLIALPVWMGYTAFTTIKSVADELIAYDRIGVIVNRVTNPELADMMQIPGLEILSLIPADSTFAANDIKGKSVMELPEDSVMLKGVREALQKIEIL